jgi:two-component system sensor histidine kinase CpxA
MRSLYVRFFLSFWTAMVLVLCVSVGGTLWFAGERWDRERDRQEEYARQASAVLAQQGEPGLRDWLVLKVQELSPDRMFLLDSHGVDLLGRNVPDFLQAALGRRPYPAHPPAAVPPRDDYRLLSQLVNPLTGETYALSLLHARSGRVMMFGIFATPETPLVFVIATLLVSTAICYLLARQLSAPIQHLRDATRSIADGKLGVQVASLMGHRRDELAMLAVDFDAMAARLSALLNAQQQLLRDVSHELRSPLARMQIALGLARRPQANLQQELDRIEQEAQRLDELIGEILSLSRLEDPVRPMESAPVAIDELLEELLDDARIEAAPRQVTLRLELDTALGLNGDHELLHRALENVVRNAVRFSPDGAEVLLEARRQAEGLLLAVSDAGPGVPPEHLQRIFEPFYRVASARDRDSGGHGIGLAIASRVIRLHGGTIRALNRSPSGLRVEILLPAQRAG